MNAAIFFAFYVDLPDLSFGTFNQTCSSIHLEYVAIATCFCPLKDVNIIYSYSAVIVWLAPTVV